MMASDDSFSQDAVFAKPTDPTVADPSRER
jgi:hypothetical protein